MFSVPASIFSSIFVHNEKKVDGGFAEVGGCAYLCGANSLLWYKKTMYTEQLRKEVERVVGRSMQSPLVCWYERNAEGEKEEWGFNYRWGAESGSAEHLGYLETCRVGNNNWQGKAFYRRADGKFAIRAWAAPTETYTTYWAVYDLDGDGRPEVDYSVKRDYVWLLCRRGQNQPKCFGI